MTTNSIRPRGENPEFRPASTLDSNVIRNAYVYEDRNAQQQIREYGKLRAKIFNELIVHADSSKS